VNIGVVIKQDDSTLSIQQQLVLNQLVEMLREVNRSGEHLDGKATTLLQSGALVVALTGALQFSPSIFADTLWARGGIALAFVSFAAMIVLAVQAWLPRTHHLPGTTNWDALHQQYLYSSADDSYARMLSNYAGTVDALIAINAQKGNLVRRSAVLLVAQIGGLLLAALM